MGDADHLLDGRDRAQHVRHVGHGDDLGAGRQRGLEVGEREVAVIVAADPLQHRALALPQEVPGHDVGMVLHDREHDLVAFPDMGQTERGRDEVHRFGGRTGEDDLVGGSGVEEGAHLLARALEGLGRGIGEIVETAMHVGIFGLVGGGDAIDHGPRFLRRGRVVEIDERLAVGRQGEGREVPADRLDVIGGQASGGLGVAHVSHRPCWRSHCPTRPFISSLTESIDTVSIASAAKASSSRACASRSGMPRARR